MSEVIVITSGKGGVGKTTTAANLGTALSLENKKTESPYPSQGGGVDSFANHSTPSPWGRLGWGPIINNYATDRRKSYCRTGKARNSCRSGRYCGSWWQASSSGRYFGWTRWR